MAAWKENVQDWLAVDAGLRELFSALKFRVTGKNTGKLRLWFQPFGDNPRAPSLLALISAIFRPIGTENYQGINRELKFPVSWVVAKMIESLAGDAL